ncbi:Crp/Fnr family transcriptional regulator [Sphingomonas mucosissima]|uniref:Crp/Fnr family transcriptional regulator n=1 Tax=Sphingomonas mucosissima TaxID=370959 RepID=UPI00146BD219|nr:Crp/Fnr family transcriptional regulator [Sphingomonas mucosissima]
MSEGEKQAILDLPAHASQVAPNIDFVRLDHTTDHACIVVQGLVGRFEQTFDGNRQITALHLPGDAADLHSVVQPKARSALHTLTTTTILRVPHAALRSVAANHPAVAEAFWRDCVIDAAILSQWVVNVGRRDARGRVAHLVCEMAVRYKAVRPEQEFFFDFPVTQAQIGDMMGLTPVHINRVLKALREEELLTLSKSRVHVMNWTGLKYAGEFTAEYLQADTGPEESLRLVAPHR